MSYFLRGMWSLFLFRFVIGLLAMVALLAICMLWSARLDVERLTAVSEWLAEGEPAATMFDTFWKMLLLGGAALFALGTRSATAPADGDKA